MTKEKISSLHDDLLVPRATGHLGEYDSYPERFDPRDKSAITRIEQFGVDIPAVEKRLGKKINRINWSEYNMVLAGAVRGYYDTVVSSVFDRYKFSPETDYGEVIRLREIKRILKMHEDMETRGGVNLVRRSADFRDEANLVLGLEAGAHLIKTVADARKLKEAGVRLFGLQYNDENALADKQGLTDKGGEIVRYLLANNLIIDLAHANPAVRKDICDLAAERNGSNLISYTHGSIAGDEDSSFSGRLDDRLLTEAEFGRIIKGGGIVGLGVTRPFYGQAKGIAERIDKACQLEDGIDHIAIGTDFGGVPPEFMNDIRGVDGFKVLADILSSDFGMKDDDIKRVLRRNVKQWIKQAID